MPKLRNGSVAVAAVLAVVVAGAHGATADQTNHHKSFRHIDIGAYGDGHGLTFTPAAQSNKMVTVMLQMRGKPVALHQAAAHQHGQQLSEGEQQAIRKQLKAKQDHIKPQIRSTGATIVGQLQSAYNGIQVQVRQKDIGKLATLPGVVAVHQVRSYTPSNVNGVPYIGGPTAWGNYGVTGKGVTVADIDTGIDYTHADFGGPGTSQAWQEAQATSTQPANPAWFGPDAPKVKGGYDFVGDDYNANDPTSVPKPDPNPLDCNGHGTHTAGTAAGFGVTSDGKTYTGPYNADTVSSHQWNVGPGVAPQATIYAYRIFGCAGSSNVVDLGIDRAVQDGVDVISMSLGSDLGGTQDPTTVAAENAAKAGVSVVAASGNAGQNAYLTSSPASGDHVLSVAALDGSVPSYPGAKLSLSTGSTVDTIDANGAPLPSGSLPVVVLKNADGSISLGCDPSEYQNVSGALVVTARGSCARVARAIYGQQAGAAAVVMVNSDNTYPPYEGKITSNPDTGEQYTVTIPFLGAKSSAGPTLLAADGGSVTLTSEQVDNPSYTDSASFTSGGPRNPDSAPKPEVIAPGVSVASAGMGTGDQPVVESGTSMATPMTSGTAALVKSAHPSWTAEEIKAAIQNTADPSKNGDYDPRVSGTGSVRADRAVNSTVLATTPDGLNSLAFGFVPGNDDYHTTRYFSVTNHGSQPATYDLKVETDGDQLGAEVKVSPATIKLAPGQSMPVQVTMSMPKSAFAALSSDDTFVVGPGQVQNLSGAVVATPRGSKAGQQTLRVEYLMVPRGLSQVKAGTPQFTSANGSSTATLPLSNSGVHDGTADVYAWGITDPQGDEGSSPYVDGSSMDIRDVGVQSFPDANGDSTLVFAVNNWGPATNQSVDEFDVGIDNNGDGKVDFYVVGVDLGAVLAGAFNGEFASFTIDANTNQVVDAFYADAPMNGSTVELPAVASELGITPRNSRFDYSVTGFSVMDTVLADPTGTASFDAFRPTVNNGQFAQVPAGGSASVPLTMDEQSQRRYGDALGWLVVSVDDASGAAQADEVAAPAIPGGGHGGP